MYLKVTVKNEKYTDPKTSGAYSYDSKKKDSSKLWILPYFKIKLLKTWTDVLKNNLLSDKIYSTL